MSPWELPTSLEVNGKEYEVETDFRQILNILACFNDANLEDDEKWIVAIKCFYKEDIPYEDYTEAAKALSLFISAGKEDDGKPGPTLMDWEQDAPLILPAVNRVLGYECRAQGYLHWWTFLGAYMEIGECLFSNVVSVRSKKAKGKKLESYEKEFAQQNKDLVNIRRHLSDEEQEKANESQAQLNELLGIK